MADRLAICQGFSKTPYVGCTEKRLLYLVGRKEAKGCLKEESPGEWAQFVDPHNERRYWWNSNTGDCTYACCPHLSPSWASVIFAVAANKLIGPNLSEIRLCVLFEGVGDTPAVPEVGQPSYYSGYPSEEEPSDHVLLYADLKIG